MTNINGMGDIKDTALYKSGETFTASDVASKYNMTVSRANDVLRELQRNGVIEQAGGGYKRRSTNLLSRRWV